MLCIDDHTVGSRSQSLMLKRLVEQCHAGQDYKSSNGQGNCATNGMPNAKPQGNRDPTQGDNDRRKQYKD
jgi:hypothetical protein